MDERDRDQLERMVVHAEAAIGYKRAGGRAWWKDPRTFDAVITRITQVGEAASKVSATTAAGIPGVPRMQIRNTRHRIVHDYMNTDVQIVREIVTRELPALVRALTKTLRPPAPARCGFHGFWPPDSAGFWPPDSATKWPPRSTGFGHPVRSAPAAA